MPALNDGVRWREKRGWGGGGGEGRGGEGLGGEGEGGREIYEFESSFENKSFVL